MPTSEPEACKEAKTAYYLARQRRADAIDGLRLLGVAVGATSVAVGAIVAFLTKRFGRKLVERLLTGFVPGIGTALAVMLGIADFMLLTRLVDAWNDYRDAQTRVQEAIEAVLDGCPPEHRPKDLQ